METLQLDNCILSQFYTGQEIKEGCLPEDLSNKNELPSLLFLNLDAMYNLFFSFYQDLKSWVEFVDKIVLDEVHTIFTEFLLCHKYNVYFQLPVLGIPIVVLSGSVPCFALTRLAKRLCLSVKDDLSDLKVIHRGDVIGDFPKGFKIKISIGSAYLSNIALFVCKCLGAQPSPVNAAHIFVAVKEDGTRLLHMLSSRYNCCFVSSDTIPETINQDASEWGKGEFDILISTTIGLVGDENPHCRYLACAGYLYDCMQIVQMFGRL